MLIVRLMFCVAVLGLLNLPALPQDGLAQGSASTAHDASALKTGALELAAGLCPAEPIWGLPPEGDALRVKPALPAVKGWCRYFDPVNSWNSVLAAAHGRVLVGQPLRDCVEIFDSLNGESLRTAPHGSFVPPVLGRDHVYTISNEGILLALKVEDGSQVWSANYCAPLGESSNGIWAVFSNQGAWHPEHASALVQLDQASGDLLNLSTIKGLEEFESWQPQRGNIVLCLGEEELIIASRQHYMENRIAIDNIESWDRTLVAMGQYCYLLQVDANSSDHGESTTDFKLSAYHFHGGLAWSQEATIASYLVPNNLVSTNKLIVASEEAESLIFSATDGQLIEIKDASDAFVVRTFDEAPEYLYMFELNKNEWPPTLSLLDQDSLELTKLFPEGEVNCRGARIDDDTLLFIEGSALYGIQLLDGLPLSGTLDLIDMPEDFARLRMEFQQHSDPRSDEALMRQVIAGGITAFSFLVSASDGSDINELKALASLACYIDARTSYTSFSMMPDLIFLKRMREIAAPAHIGLLESLLNDDSLQPLHHELLGILALCGDEAAPILEEQYARRYPMDYAPALPPYQRITKEIAAQYFIEQNPEITTEDQQKGAAEAAAAYMEASVTAADGTVYTLFNNPGLQCLFDMYIGVDRVGDGSMDEVLPTGLLGISPPFNGSTIISEMLKGVEPPTPMPDIVRELELSFDGESFTIGSVWPIYGVPEWPEEYFDPAPETEEEQEVSVVGYEWREVELTLVDLRNDSDGDGLTDISEGLLLTDPANADTDADGISDLLDHSPLVYASRMSKEERGAARAIAYLFDNYPPFPRETKFQKLPVQTSYVWVNGLGPVAFSTAQGTKSICPHELAKREAFLGPGGGGMYSALHVMTWRAPEPDEVVIDYNIPLDLEKIEEQGIRNGRTLQEELQLRSAMVDELYYTLDFWQGSNWLTVYLLDVDGELYPVKFSGNYGFAAVLGSLL